ncbi:MAG: recombination mediator RecR [Prevotella sp.]|nr:recombination mediator RecR [Staphylococcus sp.]MCM1350893.1 recombination mediator RecR [Prevotella sp.]
MSEIKFLDPLAKHLEKLPGVGKKTAQRYAYHIIEKMTEEEVAEFANELIRIKSTLTHCAICGVLSNQPICEICNSSYRDHSQIMVVKDTKDVFAIEKTGQYNGVYHVLKGLISPLEGIGPDDLNIDNLEKRINENVKEVILATSFTPSGETTALYLEKILKKDNVVVSRIGYGLPAGGDIEYVDELTLKRAIDSRVNSKS